MTSGIIPDRNFKISKKSILIIDDHKLIRESLSQILNNHASYNVAATCGCAEEGIKAAKVYQPDFVITDINMPGMSGVDAIALIKDAAPGTKIIGMSMHTQPAFARKMIKNGACGYVTKSSPVEELLTAMNEADQGKKYICTKIKDLISEQYASDEGSEGNGINSLSDRELEIIELIRTGLSSKGIASELHIAVKTVEVHRYNILKKLKLSNAAALVNYINSNYLSS